VNTSGSRNIV